MAFQKWLNLDGTYQETFSIGFDPTKQYSLKLPASTTPGHITWTLPVDNGLANYVLANDSTGVLSWVYNGPAGADTDVQYNDNGSFGGSPKFTWTDSTSVLTTDYLAYDGLSCLIRVVKADIKKDFQLQGQYDGTTYPLIGPAFINIGSASDATEYLTSNGGTIKLMAGSGTFYNPNTSSDNDLIPPSIYIRGIEDANFNNSGILEINGGKFYNASTPSTDGATVIGATIKLTAADAIGDSTISSGSSFGGNILMKAGDCDGRPNVSQPGSAFFYGGNARFNYATNDIAGGGAAGFIGGIGDGSRSAGVKLIGGYGYPQDGPGSSANGQNYRGGEVALIGGNAGNDTIAGGANGGNVSIIGGLSSPVGGSNGGHVYINGGSNPVPDVGLGGDIILTAGWGSGNTDPSLGGRITLITGSTDLTPAIRLQITQYGDWVLNGDSGTSGQVLTSQGLGTPPLWTTPTTSTMTPVVLSTTTPNQVVDTFDITVYRSAEYTVQVASGTDYEITKIIVIHNGTTSFSNEYGTILTGAAVATFSTAISGTDLQLLVTPVNPSTTVTVVRTAIHV